MKCLAHILFLFVAILSQLLFSSCRAQTATTTPQDTPLRTGAEVFLDNEYALGGHPRFAVVANQTSMVGNTHLVDTLLALGADIRKIFCPEHGFRGTAAAGAKVDNSVDPKTGIPIVSLYGKNKKPTKEQLKDVAVVIFDLQDVGCRFYTYISTLHYVMEACAENGITLMVLDRPNPNGHYVDGPVLDTAKFRSFIGMHPVPIVYGLTIGEYATMINGEQWLANGVQCDLTIITMQGYRRDSIYTLPVSPSPNLRNGHAIALYPSLCLFEGTNISVGRGTEQPFELLGIPWQLSNWTCTNTIFTIGDQTAPATQFAPKGEKPCIGIALKEVAVPAKFDLKYLLFVYSMTKEGCFFKKTNGFEKLAGNDQLRKQIEQGLSEEEIRASWEPALSQYKQLRKKYLLYPDME